MNTSVASLRVCAVLAGTMGSSICVMCHTVDVSFTSYSHNNKWAIKAVYLRPDYKLNRVTCLLHIYLIDTFNNETLSSSQNTLFEKIVLLSKLFCPFLCCCHLYVSAF